MEQSQNLLHAETENIAKGGIGMVCPRPLPPGSIVRCEIAVSDRAAYIPTLLKVRWTDLPEGRKRYRLGLQFLL